MEPSVRPPRHLITELIDRARRAARRPLFLTVALLPLLVGCPEEWNERLPLHASDPTDGDSFGRSLAIDGDLLVVGANTRAGKQEGAGAAYLFRRLGETWSEGVKLEPAIPARSGKFGAAVAVSGDTVAVGARQHQPHIVNETGVVYAFELRDEQWQRTAILTDPDPAEGNLFGSDVALDGDTLAIGARGHDYGEHRESGSVYLYQRRRGAWYQTARLEPSDVASNEGFGAVALDGEVLVVGARFVKKIGAAYVFERRDGEWRETAKLEPPDGARGDQFGAAVAVFGDTIVVGAIGADEIDGAVYLYRRAGDGWTFRTRLTPDQPKRRGRFGASLSLHDDVLVVGAFADNHVGDFAGAAYLFARIDGDFSSRRRVTAEVAVANDRYGVAVATDGTRVMVGASKVAGGGVVHVYSE